MKQDYKKIIFTKKIIKNYFNNFLHNFLKKALKVIFTNK